MLVPDAFAISHLGLVLAPSRARPGSYDQHDAALAILRDVSRTHGAALQRIPQRGRYAAHRYLPKEKDVVVSAQREELRKAEEAEVARLKAMAEAAGKAWDAASFKSVYEDESDLSLDRKGFTLADMVDWGLRHPSALTDTLIDLLSELRQTTEFPVLIAVDGINHFYTQGPYAAEGELLPPESLSVQAAFCPWGASGFKESMQFKRGLWLCAVSHTHSMDMKPMFSVAAVHDRYRVAVPPLTRQEIYSTLKHYAACGTFFMLQGESSERSPSVMSAHCGLTATVISDSSLPPSPLRKRNHRALRRRVLPHAQWRDSWRTLQDCHVCAGAAAKEGEIQDEMKDFI